MGIKDTVLALRRRSGVYAETQSSLETIDNLITTLTERFTWNLWDKTSSINGVPAASLLQRPDMPSGGEAYLIHDGDKAIIFQPHTPDIGGITPMTTEEAYTVGERAYEEMVASLIVQAMEAPQKPDTDLDRAKAQKLSQIADARWRTETAPFYWAEKDARFDTSERSQVKYLQAAQKGKTQTWKTADGWVEMQPGDFIDLITAYETFIEELFIREATLAAQVQAAQTVPDVEAIEW